MTRGKKQLPAMYEAADSSAKEAKGGKYLSGQRWEDDSWAVPSITKYPVQKLTTMSAKNMASTM